MARKPAAKPKAKAKRSGSDGWVKIPGDTPVDDVGRIASGKAKTKQSNQRKGTEKTEENQRPAHLFKPGQSGNPAGRPKGSRNKLCKRFIEDLRTVWEELNENGKPRGIHALREVAKDRPTAFVATVGNLVPREFDLGDKTQGTFRALWTALASGKLPAPEPDEDDDE